VGLGEPVMLQLSLLINPASSFIEEESFVVKAYTSSTLTYLYDSLDDNIFPLDLASLLAKSVKRMIMICVRYASQRKSSTAPTTRITISTRRSRHAWKRVMTATTRTL